jgi:hypothetical protein
VEAGHLFLSVAMIFIAIPILLLLAYVIGLIGVMHMRESRSKIIGLLYGIPVMFLSLILLIPSLEIIDRSESLSPRYCAWTLLVASPLIFSWLTIWNGFRKRDAGAKGIIGIVIAAMIVGVVVALYFWPEPIRLLDGVILYLFPSAAFPML